MDGVQGDGCRGVRADGHHGERLGRNALRHDWTNGWNYALWSQAGLRLTQCGSRPASGLRDRSRAAWLKNRLGDGQLYSRLPGGEPRQAGLFGCRLRNWLSLLLFQTVTPVHYIARRGSGFGGKSGLGKLWENRVRCYFRFHKVNRVRCLLWSGNFNHFGTIVL